MIFTNARLIFTDGIRDGLEVIVGKGKIAAIRESGHGHSAREFAGLKPESQDVIDLDGNYLAPGFIDLHVHGALGRDTMEASVEGFRIICDFHGSGGTTSLLLTTATAPIEKIVEVLKAVGHSQSCMSRIAGVHVEGPFISKAKPGAQRTEFIREPSADRVEQLLEYAD